MPDSNTQDSRSLPIDLWYGGISQLEDELDPQIYSAFIKPLKFCTYNKQDSEIVVTAPSKLVCNHVDKNFKGKIEKVFSSQFGIDDLSVKFSVNSDADGSFATPRSNSSYVVVKKIKQNPLKEKANEVLEQEEIEHNVNPKYTFSNFVVGSNNQFCHAAAMHVAEEPGEGYNPLFIYGGVGLGKTHLMHAIGNAVLQRDPNSKVLYMSSEAFTNELIQSLRMAKMDVFKNKLRGIDLLLIDDIQFMCGKERTQEEFFHTFNALHNAKHQIVITSDKIPQEIPGFEERLKTRFSWGLIADLQSPDFETRVAILKRKAAVESFELPEDVAHFIAEKVSSNVRELEGALTRVYALGSLQKIPLNLRLAQSALKPLIQQKSIHLSINDIKKAVCNHFDIKVSEIESKRRTRNLAFPRHIAMYLCRKHTSSSYPEIGSSFGGRDHSSVIHATSVIGSKLRSSIDVQEHVHAVERELLKI